MWNELAAFLVKGKERIYRADVAGLDQAVAVDISGRLLKRNDMIVAEHEDLRCYSHAVAGSNTTGPVNTNRKARDGSFLEVTRHWSSSGDSQDVEVECRGSQMFAPPVLFPSSGATGSRWTGDLSHLP